MELKYGRSEKKAAAAVAGVPGNRRPPFPPGSFVPGSNLTHRTMCDIYYGNHEDDNQRYEDSMIASTDPAAAGFVETSWNLFFSDVGGVNL